MIGRDETQGVLPFTPWADDESRVVPSADCVTMWRTAPLASVAQIASGVTKGRRLTETVQEVPYLRVANVQAGHLALSDIRTIPASPDEVERFRLRKGDVLMTEGGDPDKLGRGALWSGAIDPCIHQNHIFRVRLDRNAVVPEYFVRLLSSAYGKQYFLRAAKQTTGIASINKTQLSAFPVPLPPLHEQRRIADILDKADAIRRKRKEAIALTEELLRSTFLDMFGDPVTNPKGWPSEAIDDLCERGASLVDGPFGSSLKPEHYVSEGVKVVRNWNIYDDRFDVGEFKYVTRAKFEELRRSEVVAGDILITTKGTVGDVCVAPDLGGPAVLSASGTVRLRLPPDRTYLPEFVVAQTTTRSFKRYLHTFEAGSAQQYLNLSAIRKMRLVRPSSSLQAEFVRLKEHVFATANGQRNAMVATASLFDSLVKRAFSGRLFSSEMSC